ncbi:MAG TPA: Ig-like domain-containing protein [Sphingomonas sp.]
MARGLGATFRFGGVRKIDADHRCDSARRYRDSRRPIPVRISRAVWAALRTILLALLVLAPTSAWAESAGCTAINALGGTFTVDGAGNGTDKFTDPGSQPLANGETVTYSWSGNTKGAYVYIVWTQGGGSAYAASSVEDATDTTGSGSFTFSGTSAGDYFQVGLANTDYFTTSTTKPSANNSSVTINLSCSAGAILGVSMTHSGNAAQGGSLAYTITPSASGSATTTALLTANFTLPSGMTYTSASGTGWTCSGSGQTGTCTRTGSFGPGAGPTIMLNAAFATNATSPLLPSVALSGGGGTNAPSAADSTIVLQRPTVTSISPTAGPLAGGTTVVVTGTNFTGATGVAFGATPATGFTVNSATQITATAPAGTGTIDVQVTTAGGASAFTAADQYTYVAAPTAANLNNAPVAFNTATPIDLSGSITGSHTSIAVVTAPAHGSTSIAGDVVTYTPSAAYAGPDSFTYTATGAGGTSAPATVTLTVAQGSQTIIFAALPDASLSASPLTLSATASSGLTVSFSSTTTSVCTVSGTTLTLLQPGACSIDANQAGNSSYTAAPTVSRSFTVTPAALVVTAGAASGATVGASYSQGNPASGGTAPYAYSLASGSLPAGTTLDPSTGTVSGTPTTAGAFSYAIGASDSQGTPATATGATVSGTIAKGDQTIGFTSTAPSAATAGGASYTISATATSHLTVTFSLDGASTGCALAGSTVTFTGAGTCRIDADQAGDSNWNAAPQVQQSFTVNAASAIGASIAFSPASLAAGSSGTLTISFTNSNATVSPAFDTLLTADTSVLSRITGAPGGTCAGFGASVPSTATVQFSNIAVPAGGCTITIGYAGSSAGTAAGFTLSGFTPSGYPTTPGATSNAVAVVPSVTAVSPNAGPAGQVVTITGAGFSATPANNTVHFGSAVGTVTAASATSLTVTTPATGSGAVTVSVTVNGQTSTGGTTYTFIDKPIAADKPGIGIAYDSTGTPIDLSGSISGGPHTSIAIGTAPSHGTTSIAGDVVTYTPATGYFGSDSFTYTATGPGGTSNVATVSLTIATPAAPVAADKPGVGVNYNSAGTPIDLAGSITGVHTSIAIGSAPAHGTTSVAGDVITYTPSAGYYGADSFTYTATGPGGTSAPATVGIVVGSPAAPSVANINGVAVPYGSSGTAIDTSAAISGVHGSIAVASGPAHGTTSVAGVIIT